MSANLTAYTAPGVVFASDEELKAHYRTEWHRHNLKRKVASLKPLTKEAFDARQSAAAALDAASGNSKRTGNERAEAKRGGGGGGGGGGAAASDDAMGDGGKRAHPQSKAAFYQKAAEMTDDQIIAERLAALPAHGLGPGVDIFSPHVSESLEANLAHMARAHGFVIPYAEYVSDLPGLVRYLQEKVYIGCTALNSDAQFHSAAACQAHMKDKGTCRFSLEGAEDEYYDYYDLHALADDSPDWHEEELPAEADDEAMDDEHVRVHVVYRPAAAASAAAAAASAAAEARGDGSSALVLGGGRELGHRSLRRYYGQSYRAEQPEHAQVQRLLLHYQQMGVIRAAPLAAGGVGGARNDRARRDINTQQRSQLSLSMKNNTLMRKKGQPSQNIIFG